MKFCFIFHVQAVRTYKHEVHMTEFLEKLDFYVLPVFNIDGYVYTWTKVYEQILRGTNQIKTNHSIILVLTI